MNLLFWFGARDNAPIILHNIPTIDARRFPYEKVPHWGYGLWRCSDGRRIVFDREYHPIIQVLADGTIEPADPSEWVDGIIEQSWFYCGVPPVKRPAIIRKCLTDLGIPDAFIGLALEGAPAPRRQE